MGTTVSSSKLKRRNKRQRTHPSNDERTALRSKELEHAIPERESKTMKEGALSQPGRRKHIGNALIYAYLISTKFNLPSIRNKIGNATAG